MLIYGNLLTNRRLMMNTPKFNAEASLYKTANHYNIISTGMVSSAQIVPQYSPGLCGRLAYMCDQGDFNKCVAYDRLCGDIFL